MSSLRTLAKTAVQRCVHPNRMYVVNYHRIAPPGEDADDVFGTQTAFGQFCENMECLGEHYRFVDLHRWLCDPDLRARSGHCVAITFDDGHASVLEYAIPLLEKLRIPATLFLNTAYWDQERRICWSEARGAAPAVQFGDEQKSFDEAVGTARHAQDPQGYQGWTRAIEEAMSEIDYLGTGYLRRSDLASVNPGFVSIGLHGHHHHRHAMFNDQWQTDNLVQNEQILEAVPGYVPLFAPPFGRAGDVNPTTFEICRRRGVTPVLHNGGYNTSRTNHVRRVAGDGQSALDLVRGQSPLLYKYDVL